MTIDNYLKNLADERNKAWHEQKAVLDTAAAAKRPLSAEEQQIIERTDAAIDQLDTDIKGWLDRVERECEADAARAAYAPIIDRQAATHASEADEFAHFTAFMRGERPGNSDGGRAWEFDFTAVAREKQAIRAGGSAADIVAAAIRNDPRLKAALGPDSATAGGNLVPTDFVRRLYDYMETYSGMRQANVWVLTTAGGNNIELPKVVTGGTAVLVGAGTAIAGSDPTFGKLTLGSWKYGEIVRVQNELLTDEGVDLEGWLARDFGRAIGRATNSAYTTGTGTNQPEGLMTVIGTGVTGANGGTGIFDYDDLIDLKYGIDSMYAENGQWMMKRATIGRARKLQDSNGNYIWQAARLPGEPDVLDGDRVVENPAMASVGTGLLSVAYGDFSGFVIRDVGSVRIARSDDRYFDTDETGWRATLRTDSGLLDLTGCVKAYRGGTA